MSYFYHPELSLGAEISLNDEESRHLSKTLRVKVGAVVKVLDGQGRVAEAKVLSVPERRGQVLCEIVELTEFPRPKTRVHLYLCPPRNNLFSQIIRQATELGVSSIHLMESEYSVARPKDKNIVEWEKNALAACKQSGNPFLPSFSPVVSFEEALKTCEVQSYYGAVPQDVDKSAAQHVETEEVAIWIGPEGGFSVEELQALKDSGAKGMCLGSWILRVETAVVAMMSQFV